jgi:hypothetical protein
LAQDILLQRIEDKISAESLAQVPLFLDGFGQDNGLKPEDLQDSYGGQPNRASPHDQSRSALNLRAMDSVEGGGESLGQSRVPGIHGRGNRDEHGRKSLHVFGKAAGQVPDPDGASFFPAEMGLSPAALPALPAESGPEDDPGALLECILLPTPVKNHTARLMTQDEPIGQQPAFDQGVIRPAKARVRDFYQYPVGPGFGRRDFFYHQSLSFAVDRSLHIKPFSHEVQIVSRKSKFKTTHPISAIQHPASGFPTSLLQPV